MGEFVFAKMGDIDAGINDNFSHFSLSDRELVWWQNPPG